MQITLIRHLPTEWNNNNMLQGRRDIGITQLTEEFRKGIAENKGMLNGLAPFEVVLASSLKRTRQTAQHYGFQPETECLLDELDFGPFEGQPKAMLVEAFGEAWLENPSKLVLGESIHNLEKRISMFLEKYREYKNMLVFGHGCWIRAMISFSKHGHIDEMNKVLLENNSFVTLTMDS
ncbi:MULTISPECIES: histidine phosphatase family protein [Neobacillus]|uniref:Histidine phosphatase family protein n=1 Tax=Neobacillus citreus TaxID=2833578 RepID=A0A942Y6D2_9BACI|nr:phosphoglycerate mutase family protein [Neobacillus citreus]MCH6264148.1 histidine phosphatase family protein [Neobacillus citreus]